MVGDDALVGETIEQYRVDRMIGKGSMGMVYYGVHLPTGTPVAVKTMSPDHGHDEELVQRFQREARVGREIQHPNVARVFTSGAYGPDSEMPYLVMEFIDGPSLADMVKSKGPTDYKLAAAIMRQAAQGLKAATDHGSIHRDIKPANIMLTTRNQVKIVDFGIARNHGGDNLRTAVGVVLGSPYYMSPEQSAAKTLDHRSDIYSLGATFYFLLTARPPFEGRNLVEIIQKRAKNDLRPINQLNPNVPNRVCDVVYRMMMNNPDERFQSYDDLIRAIDGAMTPQAAQPAAPERTGVMSPDQMAAFRQSGLAGRPGPQAPGAGGTSGFGGSQSGYGQGSQSGHGQQPQQSGYARQNNTPSGPRPAHNPPARQKPSGPWWESGWALGGMIVVGLSLISVAAYLLFFYE